LRDFLVIRGASISALLLGFLSFVGTQPANKASFYSFNLPDIQGKMVSFEQFKGKVVLLVNVASNSIFTPQYAGLESLYQKYKASGFFVLAFPSNDFGAEEPDPDSKIEAFCRQNYHITFPLFSKLAIRGDDITPLFHFLTKEANPKLKGDVHWNFSKFLIDRKGDLVARFESEISPDDPNLLVAVENALSDKKPAVPESPQTPPADSQSPRTRADE
jgi:glutathione peroxidase